MKNLRQLIMSAACILGTGLLAGAQNHVVWQIGEKDDSFREFAVAEKGYNGISKVFPEGMAV